MPLHSSHYIGQVVHLRLLINGEYPEQESGQQYIILDAGESSLFGLRADAIEAKDFTFYVLPLSGDVHYEITGVADGRGVLLRLQNHLPNLLTVERIIGTTRSYQIALVKYGTSLHRINQLLARSAECSLPDEEEDDYSEEATQLEPLAVEEDDYPTKTVHSFTVPASINEITIRLTLD